MNGMHDDRLFAIHFLEVQHPLDTQDIRAVGLGHNIQCASDPVPFKRLVIVEHEGMNVIVMPTDIMVMVSMCVIMAVVIMAVVIMVVIMHMAFRRPVGFFAQPLADIRALRLRIIKSGIEKD